MMKKELYLDPECSVIVLRDGNKVYTNNISDSLYTYEADNMLEEAPVWNEDAWGVEAAE